MPTFKVEVEKSLGLADGRNPFLIRDIFQAGLVKTSIRVFEFEAADEAEVKSLYEAAIAEGIANVKGYTIRSIEEV